VQSNSAAVEVRGDLESQKSRTSRVFFKLRPVSSCKNCSDNMSRSDPLLAFDRNNGWGMRRGGTAKGLVGLLIHQVGSG
jgi:hypothetical protein